jgi:hypothetical protein
VRNLKPAHEKTKTQRLNLREAPEDVEYFDLDMAAAFADVVEQEDACTVVKALRKCVRAIIALQQPLGILRTHNPFQLESVELRKDGLASHFRLVWDGILVAHDVLKGQCHDFLVEESVVGQGVEDDGLGSSNAISGLKVNLEP